MNDAEEFNDEPVRQSYDKVSCPNIGEIVECVPEVQEFEVGSERYRIVLIGKKMLSGWAEKPVFAIERKYGTDALGVIVWVDANAKTFEPMLSSLFMACRAKLKSALIAERVAERVAAGMK